VLDKRKEEEEKEEVPLPHGNSKSVMRGGE